MSKDKKYNNDRKYFTIIPNIIDDMDMSLSALRLYLHIKRVCGAEESKGACFQSTRTLAENCGIAVGTVTKAKMELLDMGLISIMPKHVGKGKPLHIIKIVDIWPENILHFSK